MSDWISVLDRLPQMREHFREDAVYVLVCDGKNRMAVAYCMRQSAGSHMWVSAKPIGVVTHWMPLPEPPRGLFT